MIEKISDILIVSDIDGTLLREANGLSEENRAAIKRDSLTRVDALQCPPAAQ